MRIKKTSQTTVSGAQVVDGYSTSTSDGYSCNYVNGKILYNTPLVMYQDDTVTLSESCDNFKKIDVLLELSGNQFCLTMYPPYNSAWAVSLWAGGGYERKVATTISDKTLTVTHCVYGTFTEQGAEHVTLNKVIGYKI